MYVKTIKHKQFDSIEIKESSFKEFLLPNHFHDTFCIGLLSNGIKSSIVEETPYLIHSNSVSIINPYQIHSDKNIDNEDCIFRMIYMSKDVVNFFVEKNFKKDDNDIIFTNSLITDPLISNAVLNFFDDPENENLLENKISYLIELLISKDCLNEKPAIDTDSKNAIDDSVENARLNFSEKIDIEKMSNESKLSKFQFIRNFKKKTGMTPASYILIHRINFAKLLLHKDIAIGQIALEAGFYDHAQFCKFFKYYTNISPTQYKRNIIQAYGI